jgi:sulfate/thiosulfate transport system permease protein
MGADGHTHADSAEPRTALQDPWLVRWGLIIAAVGVVGVLVIVPVINVFYEALARGPVHTSRTYWRIRTRVTPSC